MATVVIIHAPEDTMPARALAEKLRQARLRVVLERPPGAEQRHALGVADAAIVLWSPYSVQQAALIEDVAFAFDRAPLFHASMRSAPAPEAFRDQPLVNLTGWRGEDEFPAWRTLSSALSEAIGAAPPTPGPAEQPPGFFRAPPAAPSRAERPVERQADDDGPGERFPEERLPEFPEERFPGPSPSNDGGFQPMGMGRGALLACIAAAVVVVAGGGAFWAIGQSRSAAIERSWAQLNRDDASALRAFLAGQPGPHRADAMRALEALEERSFRAASAADTVEAMQRFLADFPEGDHTIEARGRIAELQSVSQPPVELPPAPETPDPDLVPPTLGAPDQGPSELTPAASEPDSATTVPLQPQ